jgi:hypothetical protein
MVPDCSARCFAAAHDVKIARLKPLENGAGHLISSRLRQSSPFFSTGRRGES